MRQEPPGSSGLRTPALLCSEPPLLFPPSAEASAVGRASDHPGSSSAASPARMGSTLAGNALGGTMLVPMADVTNFSADRDRGQLAAMSTDLSSRVFPR
jgi:hypothetical protein